MEYPSPDGDGYPPNPAFLRPLGAGLQPGSELVECIRQVRDGLTDQSRQRTTEHFVHGEGEFSVTALGQLERAYSFKEPERHAARPGHALVGKELDHLDRNGAPRTELREHLE